MNKVILMGRLTRDPNVRYSPRNNSQEEMAIARYTLAVDRRGAKDGQQSADFIPCVAFGEMESSQKNISSRERKWLSLDGFRRGHIRTETVKRSIPRT
jgi:single-stranded DNA-binding protein